MPDEPRPLGAGDVGRAVVDEQRGRRAPRRAGRGSVYRLRGRACAREIRPRRKCARRRSGAARERRRSISRATSKLLLVSTATRASRAILAASASASGIGVTRGPQRRDPLVQRQRAAQALAEAAEVGFGVHRPGVAEILVARPPDRRLDEGRRLCRRRARGKRRARRGRSGTRPRSCRRERPRSPACRARLGFPRRHYHRAPAKGEAGLRRGVTGKPMLQCTIITDGFRATGRRQP